MQTLGRFDSSPDSHCERNQMKVKLPMSNLDTELECEVIEYRQGWLVGSEEDLRTPFTPEQASRELQEERTENE